MDLEEMTSTKVTPRDLTWLLEHASLRRFAADIRSSSGCCMFWKGQYPKKSSQG